MPNYYPVAQWHRDSYYGIIQIKVGGKVIRNVYLKTPRPDKNKAIEDAIEEIRRMK